MRIRLTCDIFLENNTFKKGLEIVLTGQACLIVGLPLGDNCFYKLQKDMYEILE